MEPYPLAVRPAAACERLFPLGLRWIPAVPLLGLGWTAPGWAQTPEPESGQAFVENKEVVDLSPFEVPRDEGYQALNTLAGTRINTALRDTAASISVFTPDFIADIGADDVNDMLNYSLGFEKNFDYTGNQQQEYDIAVNARNLGISSVGRPVARNFFLWFLSGDSFNTERVTFSRGPNSILFGLGDAGGIIDTTTKRALMTNQYEVVAKTDNHGSLRTTFDLNQAYSRNFAVRLNGLWENENDWHQLDYKNQVRGHLAATYRLSNQGRTTFRIDLEKGDVDQLQTPHYAAQDRFSEWVAKWQENVDPSTVDPRIRDPKLGYTLYDEDGSLDFYRRFGTNDNELENRFGLDLYAEPYLIYNGATGQIGNYGRFSLPLRVSGSIRHLTDFSQIPRDLSVRGPSSTTDFDYWTWSGFVEHQFAPNFYVELGLNQQVENRLWRRPNNSDLFVDTNRVTIDGELNPYFGYYYTESQYSERQREREIDNARLIATYLLDLERWGVHNFALMSSYERLEEEQEDRAEYNTSPLLSPNFFKFRTPTLGSLRLQLSNNPIYRRTYLGQGFMDLQGGNQHTMDIDDHPLPTATIPLPPSAIKAANDAARVDTARDWHYGEVLPALLPAERWRKEEETASFLFATQSKFLKNRLVMTFGWRHDIYEARNLNDDLDDMYVSEAARELAKNYLQSNSVYQNWVATGNETERLKMEQRYLTSLATAQEEFDNTFGEVVKGGINTQTLGFVWHATDWMAPFVNMSSNFGPQGRQTLDIETSGTKGSVGNIDGQGYDAGIKLFLFENKITASLEYFTTSAANVAGFSELNTGRSRINQIWKDWDEMALNNPNVPIEPTGIEIDPYYDTSDSESSGLEFEVVVNRLLPGVRLMANFSYAEGTEDQINQRTVAYYDRYSPVWRDGQVYGQLLNPSSSGTAVFGDSVENFADLVEEYRNRNGRSKEHTSTYKFNTFLNYSFPRDSWLGGFDVGVGAKWRSAPIISHLDAKAEDANLIVQAYGEALEPGREGEERKGDESFLMDFKISYTRDLGKHLNLRVQLNVTNLLDEDDLVARGYASPTVDPLKLYPSTFEIPDPRTYYLTVSLAF